MSLFHRWQQGWDDPDKLAVHTPRQRLRYADLVEQVRRAVGWLRAQDLGFGDVLAIQTHKDPSFLTTHLAALSQGVITLPLNDRYTPAEVGYMVEDAGAKHAILVRSADVSCPITGARDLPARLAAHTPVALGEGVDLECIGVICYTSGTTGKPKGARIRQRNILACVEALHQAWRWRADDVLVHALPLYHVHGLFVAAHGALRANAAMRWLDAFDAHAVFDGLTTGGGTVFMGVPTFYNRLLAVDDFPDLSAVRLFTSGSAPLPASVHREFQRRTGQAILERYGMTEVGIVLSNPYDGERRPGAVGFPLPGVEARVVHPEEDGVGELQIRGRSVFAGYHNRPEATAATFDGDWMKTGDYAFLDADGYINLVGRRSDLILCGGLNIYPSEVEAVIIELPGVREVAVFGLPDPDLGEIPAAALVGEGLDTARIHAETREHLSGYKVPRRLFIVDTLPRNTMGKVQKKALRERYASLKDINDH